MGTADITLRHLTHEHPDALLQGLPFPRAEVVGWLDSQRTAVSIERRPDKGLALRVNGEPRTLSVEIEHSLRGTMGRRVHKVQALFPPDWPSDREGPPPPIATLVIVLSGRKEPWPKEHEYRTGWPELGWSGVRYYVDAVYQCTVEELCNRGSVFWLAFTPLARDITAHKIREIVRAIRERVAAHEERAELYAAMLVLADIAPWGYNVRTEIEAMIEDDEEDVDLMTVSVTLQRAFEKGKQEGIERGKHEGLELGKQEGIEIGKHEGLELGKQEGIELGERKAVTGMLRHLFMRHAGRPPTEAEQRALSAKAHAGDPDEVQHLALTLEGERLITWLTDARTALASTAR